MRVLITGGAGFLGMTTAEALAERGHEVVITTRRRSDPLASALATGSELISLETCDLFNEFEVIELFSRYEIDRVVHTATAHMFASTRAANFPTYRMLFNCLEAATTRGVGRFVLAGSIVVYRGLRGPFREDMPLPSEIADNPPAALQFVPHFETTVKRVEELIALDYGLPAKGWDRAAARGGRTHEQLDVVVTRCPTQFGPRYTSMYSPLSNCVHAAVRGGGVAPDRLPRDMFDAVYIKDSASALAAIVEAEALAHRIYNVSSSIRPTVHDLLTALYDVVPEARDRVGLDVPPQTVGTDDYLDITRIETDLGWKPSFTLETALADYAAWLGTNPF